MSDIGSKSDLGHGNGGHDPLQDTMNKARSTVGRGYEEARDQIQEAYGAARKNLRQADSYLRNQMRAHPMTSAATAVGIGLIVGMMFAGRRS
jgi:ElaB/YqjD/DUF883 family membrane-anchored ribosome-binding protein